MDMVQELLGDQDPDRDEKYVGYRVIADHGRAATFMIADGVRPGSTGAGYVLRMITRRAARFGRKIGFTEPFLANVAHVFIEEMGEAYPEIKQRRDHILRTLTQEEEKFERTVDNGLAHLQQIVTRLQGEGETTISGDEAFDLYATYGLPLEITRDVVGEMGLGVDEPGFKQARDAHAAASGAGKFDQYETGTNVYSDALLHLMSTGQLENGTILHEFVVPPFNSNAAWVVFDIGLDGAATAQVCLFFPTAGCIPGATQAVVIEGQFTVVPVPAAVWLKTVSELERHGLRR